jgi:hypothetical protein
VVAPATEKTGQQSEKAGEGLQDATKGKKSPFHRVPWQRPELERDSFGSTVRRDGIRGAKRLSREWLRMSINVAATDAIKAG